MFYVYFAESLRNHKVYVGQTSIDPGKRVDQHNQGANTFTKNNAPFKLIYFEQYHCKKDAISRELFYKSGFGKQIKKAIILTLKEL
jgi:putative endonuclease